LADRVNFPKKKEKKLLFLSIEANISTIRPIFLKLLFLSVKINQTMVYLLWSWKTKYKLAIREVLTKENVPIKVDINEESTSMKNVPVVSDLNVPKGVCPVRKERIENERKKKREWP
jgi:hypothetical protein